jgi:A/G-specific adenine glycosylase
MSRFADRLLAWYQVNKRRLPWRGHSDPYAVWVSEIMLQQTRVEAVVPYFHRWMERFPTIGDLARAPEREVLKMWEGMGYYARARNLRKAAQIVMKEHGGRLPPGPDELRKLPGIGRYTAGAIASIAFGLDEPALDGNIRRVLARVFNITEVADSPRGAALLWSIAGKHLPKGRAGDYNQAMMDLGATICIAATPHCLVCPVNRLCTSRRLGIQADRPVLTHKKAGPHRIVAAAIITRGRKVLLAQRPSTGLLGGMWEFPNGRVRGAPANNVAKVIREQYQLEVEYVEPAALVRHAYSHFSVEVHAFKCKPITVPRLKYLRWVTIRALGDFPMGRVDRQIARKLAE